MDVLIGVFPVTAHYIILLVVVSAVHINAAVVHHWLWGRPCIGSRRRGLALPVENLGENSKDSSKALSVETGMFSEEAMLSARKGAKGIAFR